MPHHTAEELAFKAEHDAITSYEEDWDGWDGPQWPIGTIQCSIRMDYVKCMHLNSNFPTEAQWTGVYPRQILTHTIENRNLMSGSGSGPTNEKGISKKVTGA